jgi:hypothetical protein
MSDGSAFEQSFVFTVVANPKPNQSFGTVSGQCPCRKQNPKNQEPNSKTALAKFGPWDLVLRI